MWGKVAQKTYVRRTYRISEKLWMVKPKYMKCTEGWASETVAYKGGMKREIVVILTSSCNGLMYCSFMNNRYCGKVSWFNWGCKAGGVGGIKGKTGSGQKFSYYLLILQVYFNLMVFIFIASFDAFWIFLFFLLLLWNKIKQGPSWKKKVK